MVRAGEGDRPEGYDEPEVESDDPAAALLGQRMEYLFSYIQPLGRRFTLQEVVDGVRDQRGAGEQKISVGRLWTLLKGKAANPTIGTLRTVAEFFGVPTAYFVDDDVAARVAAQLALLAAMRTNDVKSVALRAATVATMSAQGVDMVRSLIEHAGMLEQRAAGTESDGPTAPGDAQ